MDRQYLKTLASIKLRYESADIEALIQKESERTVESADPGTCFSDPKETEDGNYWPL